MAASNSPENYLVYTCKFQALHSRARQGGGVIRGGVTGYQGERLMRSWRLAFLTGQFRCGHWLGVKAQVPSNGNFLT